MQPALKTRLLGAFVLIALAVIVVPLFFSREPSDGGQSISLSIPPPPNQKLQTRTLSVAPPASATASVSAQSPASNQLATVNIPSRVPPAVNPGVPEAAHASGPPTASAAPGDTATQASAQAPAPVKSAAANSAAPTANPGRAANAHYLINLGAYAKESNARQLVARVGKLGYAAHVSAVSIGGKPAARVDAGPFSSRAAAEAARLKLHAALPHAPAKLVSAPSDQSGNAPAKALPKARAGGWAVQVIAYDQRSDATQLRDRLRKAGFDSYVDDVVSRGNTLWRVRVGPLAQRSDAVSVLGRIKGKFPELKGVVVTVP